MRACFRTLCVVMLVLAAGAVAGAQNRFYLKNGDRVVFYGDSITDQRLYTTFVETYVVTRFPNLQVSFVHSGWGGDRVGGGGGGKIDRRLERDVYAYKPTVVTVMLGMNDGSYRKFDDRIYGTYTTGLESIVKNLKTNLPGVRITLIQPSPFDDVTRQPQFEGGYNGVLVRFGQFVKDLAQKEGATAADLNSPVVAMLQKAQAEDESRAKKIIPDRVHPSAAGHLIMAESLLKSWDAPATVAAVEIDAAGSRVVQEENTKVAVLKCNGAISWTQLDNALPLPVDTKDPIFSLILHSSDVEEALNREPMKVSGLKSGKYELRIDGQPIGTFGNDELARGINLAMLDTPMHRQAEKVHELTVKHNDLHFGRWRSVQVPMEKYMTPTGQKALAELDGWEAELIKQQRAAARPVPHKFELIPQ